jgi:hypothetical protein
MLRVGLFAIVLLAGGNPGERPYTGPTCLGPYCFDRVVLLRTLFKRLVRPAAESEPVCFQSQDGQTFLGGSNRLDSSRIAGEVLLSDFPNCVKFPIQLTTDNLLAWKTKEGIGLGSSEEEVLKAFGQPNSILKFGTKPDDYMLVIRGYHPSSQKPPQIGDTRFIYYDNEDLRSAEFGFRNRKVCWIWLAYNE